MDIYTPYTYLIGWSKHNKFYYGRRTAKGCNPTEFWVSYFTSSKYVTAFRKENGEPDIIQIRKTFPNNPDGCKLWESKFLERVNAQHNPLFLNLRNSDVKWDTTGTNPWNKGKTGVYSTETRRKISETISKTIIGENNPFYNKKHSKETKTIIGDKNARFTYMVYSPTGETYIVHNLKRFCEEYNLTSAGMFATAKGTYPKHKGWSCKKLT